MLRFIFFAVIAYFVYQFVMAVDWNQAGNKATREVENTASDAVNSVENSSVGQVMGDSVDAIKNFILP